MWSFRKKLDLTVVAPNSRSIFFIGVSALVAQCAVGAPDPRDYFEADQDVGFAKAVSAGDLEKMSRLIAGGENINLTGSSGVTFLAWSLVNLKKDCFAFLLEHGANPNLQFREDGKIRTGDAGYADQHLFTNGRSVTDMAAQMIDPWYLEQVLKHGGNPNLENPFGGFHETPLLTCLSLYDFRDEKQSRTENVKLLIAAGANVNYRDSVGTPVIVRSAWLVRYDLVYLLLVAGADPTVKNKYGLSIITQIQKSNRVMLKSGLLWQSREKVVALLRAKGLDLDKIETNRGHHPPGPQPTQDAMPSEFEKLYPDTHVSRVELLVRDPQMPRQTMFKVFFYSPPDPREWWVNWTYWDNGNRPYK